MGPIASSRFPVPFFYIESFCAEFLVSPPLSALGAIGFLRCLVQLFLPKHDWMVIFIEQFST